MYNNKFDKPNFLLRLRSFVVKLLGEYWAFRNFRLKGVGRELAKGLHSPPFPVSAPLHKNTAKQLLYIVRNKKVGFSNLHYRNIDYILYCSFSHAIALVA